MKRIPEAIQSREPDSRRVGGAGQARISGGNGLLSARVVKAEVFLLARLWPTLAGSEPRFWLVGGAGVCTLVPGAFAAM